MAVRGEIIWKSVGNSSVFGLFRTFAFFNTETEEKTDARKKHKINKNFGPGEGKLRVYCFSHLSNRTIPALIVAVMEKAVVKT
mgnify:CR=1 FL=1